MSVVDDMHAVIGWLKAEVCPRVSLKEAPPMDAATAD